VIPLWFQGLKSSMFGNTIFAAPKVAHETRRRSSREVPVFADLRLRRRMYALALFLVLFIFTLVTVSLIPWPGLSGDEERLQAKLRAEVLGYQVGQLYIEQLQEQGSFSSISGSHRGPASTASPEAEESSGLMGSDPWGRPFFYRVTRDSEGRTWVVMWSNGPNGVLETVGLRDGVLSEIASQPEKGDDVRVILSL
ncbi:MAG: hypothetical protein N2578_04335, partial [Bdellovibrionaceae bacterium]|nr:hypothetical protein [Pseudobdellovibrionaceae bacterium]